MQPKCFFMCIQSGPAKAGSLIFIVSPSFYTVQRFLPILLNQIMTPPVRDAVCQGFLRQKGVECDVILKAYFEATGVSSTLRIDMYVNYTFLSSDMQLVMLGIAARAISILQLQLRAVGLKGRLWELLLRGVVFNAALFYILTIAESYN